MASNLETDRNTTTEELLAAPNLAQDLRLIRRYAFVHSDMQFRLNVPLIGPLLERLVYAARWVLRGLASLGLGRQDEFNAAVADILFEFTRRASTPTPLTLDQAALDQLLDRLTTAGPNDQADALRVLGREVQLLRDQVRAAQLSAAESERALAALRSQVELLKRERSAQDVAGGNAQ